MQWVPVIQAAVIGNFGFVRRLVAHPDPDQPPFLSHRVGRDPQAVGRRAFLRRHTDAPSVGAEFKPVIQATHIIPVALPRRQPRRAVRTDIGHGRHRAIRGAIQQHRLPQNPAPKQRAAIQFRRHRRDIPVVTQEHESLPLRQVTVDAHYGFNGPARQA